MMMKHEGLSLWHDPVLRLSTIPHKLQHISAQTRAVFNTLNTTQQKEFVNFIAEFTHNAEVKSSNQAVSPWRQKLWHLLWKFTRLMSSNHSSVSSLDICVSVCCVMLMFVCVLCHVDDVMMWLVVSVLMWTHLPVQADDSQELWIQKKWKRGWFHSCYKHTQHSCSWNTHMHNATSLLVCVCETADEAVMWHTFTDPLNQDYCVYSGLWSLNKTSCDTLIRKWIHVSFTRSFWRGHKSLCHCVFLQCPHQWCEWRAVHPPPLRRTADCKPWTSSWTEEHL